MLASREKVMIGIAMGYIGECYGCTHGKKNGSKADATAKDLKVVVSMWQ